MSSRSPNVPLWIFAALAVTACCFRGNLGGAWYGGPAKPYHLLMTLVYMGFWGIFTAVGKNSGVLSHISLVVSGLTFAASLLALIVTVGGDFLLLPAVVLALFSAVPMYGLRFLFQWPGVYAVSALLSFCWLVFAETALPKCK